MLVVPLPPVVTGTLPVNVVPELLTVGLAVEPEELLEPPPPQPARSSSPRAVEMSRSQWGDETAVRLEKRKGVIKSS